MKRFVILLLLIFISTPAFATIDIVPQKIVIQQRERSAEFTILNLYNQRGTFRVELLNYEQQEDGIYKILDHPLNNDFTPSDVVRFSPRQFSLEPGGRQKIRLSLRKPGDLPEGEYRFHVKTSRFANETERAENQENVMVMMNTAVVIPVIVRHGNVNGDATIKAATLNSNGDKVKVTIERTGSASTIGKLDVISKKNNKEKKIGMISNANIFEEINSRTFEIPLKTKATGSLIIRYSDDVHKGKIFDEMPVTF